MSIFNLSYCTFYDNKDRETNFLQTQIFIKPQNMLFVRNAAALGRQTSSYHRGQRSTSGDIRPTQSKKAILKMLGMNQIFILFK